MTRIINCKKCDYTVQQYNGYPCNVCKDKVDYWNNINEIKDRQTSKGLQTYGMRLEDNIDMDISERLTMLEEELIDGLMYIEHIKERLKAIK